MSDERIEHLISELKQIKKIRESTIIEEIDAEIRINKKEEAAKRSKRKDPNEGNGPDIGEETESSSQTA